MLSLISSCLFLVKISTCQYGMNGSTPRCSPFATSGRTLAAGARARSAAGPLSVDGVSHRPNPLMPLLVAMGIYEDVKRALAGMGLDLEELIDEE